MNSSPARPSDSMQPPSLLGELIPYLAMLWLVVFWLLFFTSFLPNASSPGREITRSDIIGLLPEIYESLFTPDPATSSRWSNLAERLDVLGVAGVIILGSLAAGRLILRCLKLNTELSIPEQWAFSGGIGFSFVSLGTLGLGMCGTLSQPLFAGLLILLILLESRHFFQRTTHLSLRNDGDAPPVSNWLRYGTLGICLPFLGCMLLGAMLPSTDFDVKEYHLGGPKEYFLAGRVQFLSHDVYTSFPFLTEMLSLTGMVIRGDWLRGAYAGQTVLMFFAPLTALGVWCIACRISGRTAGWLAALCYLTTPWTYRISIIAYTEGALCCYVALAFLALLIWDSERCHNTGVLPAGETSLPPDETGSSSPFFRMSILSRESCLCGLMAGSAVATKYPGMVLVAIPVAMALFVLLMVPPRYEFRTICKQLLAYAVGVLLTFGPWMAKNLIETGNPVYPLLYGVFGGLDWSPELHAKWQAAHPARLFAGTWEDFAGVFYRNDWQSPLLFGLAPLAFLDRNRRGMAFVGGYALILLASWYLLTHRIDRFWVPMNSIMAVLAGCGLAAVFSSGPATTIASGSRLAQGKRKPPEHFRPPLSRKMFRAVAAALTGGALIYNFGFITTPLGGYNAYLGSYAAMEQQTKTQSVQIIDWLKLPPGSKVLFVGDAALFNADFPYAYNTVFDQSLLEKWTATPRGANQWDWLPIEEIQQNLAAQGITHVFVNWDEILRYRTTYGYTDFVTPARFEELVSMHILEAVPLPESIMFRPWKAVLLSGQQEIDRFAPGLKTTRHREPVMIQYQCYRVLR